ncbi:16S rRNA (uracil(1498)-N(3))-methyltransferase [Liquorilactobacillus oeni]|uniref:Ribosomal RNA small subunit methyltransferase E n=1 Tax=Liquorilactobacillus oeni DSM 19972 TaxID=1423777 RepID=A0A0R1M875_9LACO|nr:16S rRNA (uracil(1498)-N(3))-methyltransferase [Liquorilactobacillus oeni]KRL04294.1 hypothetical protein FD46_GL001419 [Liquorilactobacillus oeni DSM 19972]
MQRYFVEQNHLPQSFILPEEIYHHAIVVLRMKSGSRFEIVTANKQVLLVEVAQVEDKKASVKVIQSFEHQVELPVDVTIMCGLSKKDKAEWIVQKSTELGAAHFVFFEADYSIAKWEQKKRPQKLNRLQKIAKNAAQQSHRVVTPQVEFISNIKSFPFTDFEYRLTAYEEAAKKGEKNAMRNLTEHLWREKLQKVPRLLAVFGPEGGLSADEVSFLKQNDFVLAGLGPRIMRAETAPLYLLSALSFALELG